MTNLKGMLRKTRFRDMSSNLMVIDVETSGLPSKRSCSFKELDAFQDARIIELAYVILSADLDQVMKERSLLIRSVDVINNSDIHGITMEDLRREGVSITSALDQLAKDLESVNTIVAHNLEFDLKILRSEIYRQYGNGPLLDDIAKKQNICTMLYGKEIMQVKKWPKLKELYAFLTGNELNQTHRALDDVYSCVRCFRAMFAKV